MSRCRRKRRCQLHQNPILPLLPGHRGGVAKHANGCVGRGLQIGENKLGGCRRVEQGGIKTLTLLRKADSNAAVSFAFSDLPGARIKECVAIDCQPFAQPQQAFQLQLRDCAVGHWPDVEQQVAVFAHNVHKRTHQILHGLILLRPFHRIVTKRCANAAARFPLLRPNLAKGGVLRRLKVKVVVTDNAVGIHLELLCKTVVDHPIRHLVVIFGKEFIQIGRAGIGDVIPENGRLIAVEQFTPMGVGIVNIIGALRDGALQVGDVADDLRVEGPVDAAGVVVGHAHILAAHGVAQFAHEITLDMIIANKGIGRLTGPHEKAVMVLGGQDDIAGVDPLKESRPGVRVPLLDRLVKDRPKLGIVEARAILRSVIRLRRATVDAVGVHIPLGIGVVGKPLFPGAGRKNFAQLAGIGGKGRHRVETPVDKDAQLGIMKPIRDLVLGDGGKGWFKRHRLLLDR